MVAFQYQYEGRELIKFFARDKHAADGMKSAYESTFRVTLRYEYTDGFTPNCYFVYRIV